MTMFACTDDLAPVKVEALVLNSESLDLTVGDSKKLEVTVLPDKAENKAVYWTSSNNEVASVNNGIVIAVAPGTAVITVISDDGRKLHAL